MMHRHFALGRWLSVAASCLSVLVAMPIDAAEICEDELNRAESAYEIGRFDDALEAIEACRQQSPPRTVRAQILALRAKVELATDDLAAARTTVDALLDIDPSYSVDPRDSRRFRTLVDELRQGTATITVSSVSKVEESLREAPATVMVITAEEIARRGYLDLEQVLHDLPGFDISRTNGATYANAYQRGFRSDLTVRTLLLIDGVEENSLTLGAAYLSRQYPLSNIEQIDVIYGPAATMYGANAFAGVISITTKDPRQQIERRQAERRLASGGQGRLEGANLALDLEAFGGSYSTVGSELQASGSSGVMSWSITGRLFQSDEQDLSDFEDWDFDPAYYNAPRTAYTDLLRIGDPAGATRFLTSLADEGLADCDGLAGCPYRIVRDAQGGAVGVELTAAGSVLATRLDQAALGQQINGRPITYSDPTEDWLVTGKLQFSNLTFGFQTWRRDEGASGWYSDRAAPGGDNLHRWIPEQRWLYLDYTRELSPTLSLRLFGRFKEHEQSGDTALTFLRSYDRGGLGLLALVRGEEASWRTNFFFESSSELRGEATVIYRPTRRFNLVSGVELRNNSIARDFVLSGEDNPAETGNTSVPDGQGSNQLNGRDIGIYTQASFRLQDDLKLIIGGRIDNNEVRETLGFGTDFNSRLALIYSPGNWVFKGIFATAFQDASNIQKFGTNQGVRVGNPDLQPETVDNLEFAASWQPKENLSFEAVVYDASYSGVAQSSQASCASLREELQQFCNSGQATIAQFQNVGQVDIRGAQVTANVELGEKLRLFANYTYTDPQNIEPLDAAGNPLTGSGGAVIRELRLGDIASHQFNLGVNAELYRKLNANLRLNYVGDRPTGRGTTVPNNLFSEIESSLVGHLAVTYRNIVRGATLQLVVNNLFDEEYFDPGIRGASQVLYAPRAPQPGRTTYLRFKYTF
ncbi:MAG: TonB-dependent receptor [Acidobacteriota bacterium]